MLLLLTAMTLSILLLLFILLLLRILMLLGVLLLLVLLLLSLLLSLWVLTWALCLTLWTTLLWPCFPHLLVISLVLRKNFFSHFLFSLMNIWVKLISIFSYREFLVIVDGNKYLFRAVGFFFWVVKLSDIWMLKSLLSS